MLRLLFRAFGKGTQKGSLSLTGYHYSAGIPYKPIWIAYPFLGVFLAAIWVGEPSTAYAVLGVYFAYKLLGLAKKHIIDNLRYLWLCLSSQKGENKATAFHVEDALPLAHRSQT